MKRALMTTQSLTISLMPVLLFTMGTVGCNYNDLKNPANSSRPRSESVTDGTPEASVDFETVRRLVFEPACLKCHGEVNPRGGVRLDTHAFASTAAQAVRDAVTSGDMPPPPPRGAILLPEQQALLLAWIDSGAPEKTVASVPTPDETPVGSVPPDETPSGVPDFALVSEKVFVPHCLNCHAADTKRGGVDLETYSEAVKNAFATGAALDIDDMPRRAPPLSPELKKIVFDWIAAGTPEFAP